MSYGSPGIRRHRLWLPLVLAASSAGAVALWVARFLQTRSHQYDPMLWNLFLAWIPLWLALGLAWMSLRRSGSRPLMLLLGVLWLLFLPNSPYMITDLQHLVERRAAPLWYDVVMVLSFAWNGLLLGFVSLYLVQQVAGRRWGAPAGWALAVMTLAVVGFGMYVGRFLRWNSWDVFVHPTRMAHQLAAGLLDPRDNWLIFKATLLYWAFLLLTYLALVGLMSLPSWEPGLMQQEEASERLGRGT